MSTVHRTLWGTALASAALAVTAAHAQQPAGKPAAQQPVLVSVDLTRVSAQIANRHGLDESLMPLSILVPAEVAARSCGGEGSVSTRQMSAPGCVVSTPSPELEAVVVQRMKADAPPPEKPAAGASPALPAPAR